MRLVEKWRGPTIWIDFREGMARMRNADDCKRDGSWLFTAAAQTMPVVAQLSAQRAFRLNGRLWAIWILCWLVMAFFSKSTKRRESPAQRLEHVIPSVIGFILIFRNDLGATWLTQALFPDSSALMTFCVAMTVAGLLFSVWARLTLGSNWSGTVTIKTGHELIRRGPYKFIRHPIYTGMLAALLATAITQRLVSGLLGFAIIYFALYRKARREEIFLGQEFGDAFAEHQEHTGMFLPRFS